ncbi:hypothetical protein MMC08_001675 [Hypocenomyce scalaris]|nr:hypothetical protein [Hypocenomyce scalaris]
MAPQFPSIQSFFGREPSVRTEKPKVRPSATETGEASSCSPGAPGDGFTASEIDDVLHPAGLPKWNPPKEYPEIDIGALVPGPMCVTIMGRIVNFYDQVNLMKMPRAAKGCLRCVVGDGTGFVVVKLWYAKIDYKLRLGQLVTAWTPHISTAEAGSATNRDGAALTMSVFPERDNSCYFMVQEQSDEGVLCKTPLGYREGRTLDGLMTLKNFVEGGSEVADGKVLVAVKSIGGRKKFITKKGNPAEKCDIYVFDDTADATLTLWGCQAASASAWKPSSTVLLVSKPALKEYTRPNLSLTAGTRVEVDPAMADAEWLRKYAQNLTKREHVNPPYPKGMFDVEQFKESQVRMLFTLADIDEFARAAPTEIFMGYLSLIITELNIMTFYQRNMLFGTECCGVPLFANATSTKCKQCETDVPLSINPRIIGPLTDETGNIATGKLIWSPEAWEQLLGRTASEFVRASTDVLKYLEHRMLFMRVTVMFGWSEEVGRLCICGISM